MKPLKERSPSLIATKYRSQTPITGGFGTIKFEPTLGWSAEFSADSGDLNPWLQYRISKKYGFEARARGFDLETESTTTPISTEFDWSAGILDGCYCDMRANIIPGLKLSWDIGVNPAWKVISKVFGRDTTLATIYGTIENPLGINFEIYDEADAYLSTEGLAGIGVKILPSIIDVGNEQEFQLYEARSDNFFS